MTKRTTEAQVKKMTVAMTTLGLTVPQIEPIVLLVFELANGNQFRKFAVKVKEIQNRK